MWDYRCYQVALSKKIPLAISRGVRQKSHNIFLALQRDGITAWGEVAPTSDQPELSPDYIRSQIDRFFSHTDTLIPQQAYAIGVALEIPRTVYAAIDMALWDWWGQQANLPLYRLWGLPKPSTPTSITLGICPPDQVAQQLKQKLGDFSFRALKVKLGSPLGIEADKAMMQAVIQNISPSMALRVDANGGWSVEQALDMIPWLADRQVEYVEQPLAKGNEKGLKELKRQAALPIYVDESCHTAADIPQWFSWVDGVNIKLMKCGGPTEALKIKHTTQAFGLKTMIGCMGESSVAISAAAHLSGDLDCVDLDAHYNLNPDPATGLLLENGITQVSDNPGLGTSLKPTFYA
ncbi:MAG: dipeptide epimerase [Flavobacteriaceae bacterium]